MECWIAVPVWDQGIEHLADVINPHLAALSRRLSREYGGCVQHLWIDLELSPSHADRRPPWPFRLQKRVSLARRTRRLGLPVPAEPDPVNVGHFSVRPEPLELMGLDLEDVPARVIEILHRRSAILEGASRCLEGFAVEAFRQDIRDYLQEITGASDGGQGATRAP